MSRERLDYVRRVHAALSSGDVDAVVALCDPNFRLDMSDRVFNPAVYHGHEGIRAFYLEVMEVWESFTWELTEVEEHDGVIVALLHSTGTARGSGLELDRRGLVHFAGRLRGCAVPVVRQGHPRKRFAGPFQPHLPDR